MKRSLTLLLAVLVIMAIVCACQPRQALSPTLTPDYAALEAAVATKLAATLTAKAPIPPTGTPEPTTPPEPTPSPTATRKPTATPQPTPAHSTRSLAYVNVGEEQEANILLRDFANDETQVLTHFAEPMNMSDLSWSRDGEWLIFVSSHDYMHSRNNEHNVFRMRPDGTDLQMITGDYVDPEDAPAPYAKLTGQVVGAEGTCFVCAQGAPGVTQTDDQGYFELVGVPVTADWARAACLQDDTRLQGDIDLSATGDKFEPVMISVSASGEGWKQAVLSADGTKLAGVRYAWSVDDDRDTLTSFEAKVVRLADQSTKTVQVDNNMRIDSLDWSPTDNTLVGALIGQDGVRLSRWDASGAPLGIVLDLHNPEDDILGIANPAYSPDGQKLAFELQHRYWWEGDRYRTDLQLITAEGNELSTLIENPWGVDARDPSWLANGDQVLYQLAPSKEDEETPREKLGEIWSIGITEPTLTLWIAGQQSYLPAARPAP